MNELMIHAKHVSNSNWMKEARHKQRTYISNLCEATEKSNLMHNDINAASGCVECRWNVLQRDTREILG